MNLIKCVKTLRACVVIECLTDFTFNDMIILDFRSSDVKIRSPGNEGDVIIMDTLFFIRECLSNNSRSPS